MDRKEMDILGLFSIFNKTNRKIIPLSYYLDYMQNAEDSKENANNSTFAQPDDFPEELFVKIIIMTKRLHEMRIYEEKEIVRFIIPKMLETLELGGILSGVSISSFDTAGVVFGENYAGWLYKGETKKRDEIFYKVPYQLFFYHSKKEDNYFICKTKNGLELRQNKVSVTNSDDKEYIIKNTQSINLTEKDMKELKASYSILFMYIKIQILLKMNKFGYLTFIEKVGENFCSSIEKDEFISYAKQYFALSIDKEKIPLAYEELSFKDFLSELLIRNNCSVDFSASYIDIIKWIEEKTNIKIDVQREYHDHMEFIKDVSNILVSKGYYLYFLIKDDVFYGTNLLLGKQKYIFENKLNFNCEITNLSENLINRYIESISSEKKLRELAKNFYQVINIVDIQSMMMNIRGNRVLDYALVKNHYLSIVSSDEDMDIYNIFEELLSRYNMPTLIKNTTIFDVTLDKLYFLEFETVNPIDRAILYADLIRKNKKLLYSFEVGDYFYLGIIEDNIETKNNFIKCANNLLKRGEIQNYVIYDNKNKETFVNLLCGINLSVESGFSYSQKDIREKFYKENSKNVTKEEADKYLSRIVLNKSEIKIYISNYSEDEEKFEFTIKAENEKYFTNQDLIFQIQKHLTEKIDFTKIFSNKICISGLRLSINRDKYCLFWDEI